MGYVAKLTKGAALLDLSSGRYALMGDFIPPSTSFDIATAGGTSANRYGGATKVIEKALPIDLTFSVRVLGGSNAEIERGVKDIANFLRQAGDANEPVYLEWRPDSNVAFEPAWGQQGSNLRLRVEHGEVAKTSIYSEADLREIATLAEVRLSCRGPALGKKQRAASAMGGVQEDKTGVTDGLSRGLIVPEATTNKFTNPVFGHGTWNTGWTASASMVATKNTDKRFILPGTYNSAKLLSQAAAQAFYQTINVGNTNTHTLSCYVKKIDSSAVTSGDCQLYYNGNNITTTYTSVGNGWYWLQASVTGIAAPTTMGIGIDNAARSFFCSGFQIEEKSYATPLAFGEMLGCAWTGTAHASTSTRTAGRARVPNSGIVNQAEGTIRVVLKWHTTSAHPTTNVLFDARGASGNMITGYYDASNDDFRLSDGTNTIDSAAQTFSIGDKMVLHFMWDTGDLRILKNGVSIASGASFTPNTLGTYLTIGDDFGGSQNLLATILGFTVYERAMTDAEALADYNNIATLVTDDQRVDYIPWFWTKDGDDVIDAVDDSTRDDWGVAGGVAGDMPAETVIYMGPGSASIGYALCLYPHESFFSPGKYFADFSGTANASALGGQVEQLSVSTSPALMVGYLDVTERTDIYTGRDVMISTSLNDAGSGLKACVYLYLGLSKIHRSDYITLSGANATLRNFLIGPFLPPEDLSIRAEYAGIGLEYSTYRWALEFKRTSGTNNVQIDYFRVFVGDILYVSGVTGFRTVIHGDKVYELNTGGTALVGNLSAVGRPIELYPERYNHLAIMINQVAAATSLSITMTLHQIYVTPRWAVA